MIRIPSVGLRHPRNVWCFLLVLYVIQLISIPSGGGGIGIGIGSGIGSGSGSGSGGSALFSVSGVAAQNPPIIDASLKCTGKSLEITVKLIPAQANKKMVLLSSGNTQNPNMMTATALSCNTDKNGKCTITVNTLPNVRTYYQVQQDTTNNISGYVIYDPKAGVCLAGAMDPTFNVCAGPNQQDEIIHDIEITDSTTGNPKANVPVEIWFVPGGDDTKAVKIGGPKNTDMNGKVTITTPAPNQKGKLQIRVNGVIIARRDYDPAGLNQPGGACGDPQFYGFQGQSFQVHGTADTVYNILSSPAFQYNALFTFLESGKPRKGTLAFGHPGNYLGRIGILIKENENEGARKLLIEVISGPVDEGLRVEANINDHDNISPIELSLSQPHISFGRYNISVASEFEVFFESDEYNIRISNSDMFLNQNIEIGSDLLARIMKAKKAIKMAPSDESVVQSPAHGILGQTWNTKIHNNRWKHIEGQLFDYVVIDGILGTHFRYNKFE